MDKRPTMPTNEALVAALARAEALVQLLRGDEDEGLRLSGRNLAGWIGAVKALRNLSRRHRWKLGFGGCVCLSHKVADQALAAFVAAFPEGGKGG